MAPWLASGDPALVIYYSTDGSDRTDSACFLFSLGPGCCLNKSDKISQWQGSLSQSTEPVLHQALAHILYLTQVAVISPRPTLVQIKRSPALNSKQSALFQGHYTKRVQLNLSSDNSPSLTGVALPCHFSQSAHQPAIQQVT